MAKQLKCLQKKNQILLIGNLAKQNILLKQLVNLQTYTARPLIFQDVLVRVSPDFATRVHLDIDEANACGYQTGDLGRILS